MYKFIMGLISKVSGKNSKYTPVSIIKEQLTEKRPLPMGRKEFHEWSDRIISGACIPGATPESIKFALADQLLHLGPTVDFEADIYFCKILRKFAINQVADEIRREIRDAAKARLEAEEKAKGLTLVTDKTSADTHNQTGSSDGKKVLENGGV